MQRKLLLIAIIIVTLLSFPKVNFGQAPDLGTASVFALFTADGAFNNIGATYATGDIGTNVGAFAGFPTPGTVVGQIHVADTNTVQAAIDVNVAYSYLNGITCDSVIGITLGNGQILTPNVYCLGAISILNGNLTLDGQGNPDAIFIFKIDGALSTSVSSNVILTNSASLSNVYWQINGKFDLGNGSVFRGTIVANGAISLLGNSSLFGRGLSRAGAISLNDNMVNTGTQPENPLPIELLNFIAHPTGVNVQLDWSTASETNNDYFTIQRSIDGFSFEEVLRMKGAGNSNTILNYSAIDNNPYDGISYYRLMQTDFDGKFTYSNLVSVDFDHLLTNEFTIYPNPFSKLITITINDVSQINKAELRIYNLLGAEMMNKTITQQSTTLETNNLPSGNYFYKLVLSGVEGMVGIDKTIHSGKLVSQK